MMMIFSHLHSTSSLAPRHHPSSYPTLVGLTTEPRGLTASDQQRLPSKSVQSDCRSHKRRLAWANIVAEQAMDRDIPICSPLPLRTTPCCANDTAGVWLNACCGLLASFTPCDRRPKRPTHRCHNGRNPSQPCRETAIEMCLNEHLDRFEATNRHQSREGTRWRVQTTT
jgi:hypothetical protein